MNKNELRKIYIHKRINLSSEEKSISDEAIFKKLTNLDLFKNSSCVLTYVSTKTEVDTKSFIEYSLMKGKTVAVPRCDKNSSSMKFYRINSLNDLEKGSFNILEPDHFCSELVDFNDAICIVPGLVFDKNGFRLGYGRGYYDRFLTENDVASVGLCYKSFLVDQLPIEAFDKAVDFVITD